LESYAADFRNKSLTDDKAKKLIDEAIAIEMAEANLKRALSSSRGSCSSSWTRTLPGAGR